MNLRDYIKQVKSRLSPEELKKWEDEDRFFEEGFDFAMETHQRLDGCPLNSIEVSTVADKSSTITY